MLFDICGDLTTSLVNLLQNIDRDTQSGAGGGFGHQFLHQFDAGENNALTGARQMRKEPVLNRIVFGRVGRVMRHPHDESGFLREPREIQFEQLGVRAITPAAVTQ